MLCVGILQGIDENMVWDRGRERRKVQEVDPPAYKNS